MLCQMTGADKRNRPRGDSRPGFNEIVIADVAGRRYATYGPARLLAEPDTGRAA